MSSSANKQTDDRRTTSSSQKIASSDDENFPPLSLTAPPAPPPPRTVLVGPVLFVIMSFVALVFTVVSVGIPWYRKQQYMPGGGPSTESLFYPFKTELKVHGQPTVTQKAGDYCWPVRRRVRALQAFAIASSAFCFLTFIFSIVHLILTKANRPVYIVMIVFAGLAFGSLTIEVSFNFNIYLWSFADCGVGSSYHSQLYEPYAGFGLTVTAWVLMAFGGIIASNELFLPMDARSVDQAIHVFTCLALIAMLFSTISCPLTHWFYKDEVSRQVTDVLLWRSRVGRFDWNLTAPTSRVNTWVKDFSCTPLIRYFRAAESFSVISCAFNAFAGLFGLLMWKNMVGTRMPAVIFSCLGFVSSLVQVALELKIYYGKWCGSAYAYHAQRYVLSAGFALAAASFCIMCVASITIIIAYVLTEKYFPAKRPTKSAKQVLVDECK